MRNLKSYEEFLYESSKSAKDIEDELNAMGEPKDDGSDLEDDMAKTSDKPREVGRNKGDVKPNKLDKSKAKSLKKDMEDSSDGPVEPEEEKLEEGLITIAITAATAVILYKLFRRAMKTAISKATLSKDSLYKLTQKIMAEASKEADRRGKDKHKLTMLNLLILAEIKAGRITSLQDIMEVIKSAELGTLTTRKDKIMNEAYHKNESNDRYDERLTNMSIGSVLDYLKTKDPAAYSAIEGYLEKNFRELTNADESWFTTMTS